MLLESRRRWRVDGTTFAMNDAMRFIALFAAGLVGASNDPLDLLVAHELGVFEDGGGGRVLFDSTLDVCWEPAKDVREDMYDRQSTI